MVNAAEIHGVKGIVSLSFAYLYEAGHGVAKEGGVTMYMLANMRQCWKRKRSCEAAA